MKEKMGRNSGFTFLELIVVMLIMMVLTAIAVPGFRALMGKNRLNGAARMIMSDFMSAKMRAASENNRFKIIFMDNHRYKILDDDNNNNSEDTGESATIRNIQSEYTDVTLNATTDPIFYPRGTAYGTTVTLTSSSGTKSVSVSIAGRVRIS